MLLINTSSLLHCINGMKVHTLWERESKTASFHQHKLKLYTRADDKIEEGFKFKLITTNKMQMNSLNVLKLCSVSTLRRYCTPDQFCYCLCILRKKLQHIGDKICFL